MFTPALLATFLGTKFLGFWDWYESTFILIALFSFIPLMIASIFLNVSKIKSLGFQISGIWMILFSIPDVYADYSPTVHNNLSDYQSWWFGDLSVLFIMINLFFFVWCYSVRILDTSENFFFRAGRAYFYRVIMLNPNLLGFLSRKWVLEDIDGLHWPDGEMKITRKSDGVMLHLTKIRGIQFLCEYEADRKWYIEGVPIKGMTVLEGGSGCGETQLLMQDAGAVKVFAIDSNPDCHRLHCDNAERLRWTTGLMNEPFGLEHLYIPHDFCKLDIEGGEEVLLKPEATPQLLGPARIELHPQKIGEEKCLALVKKFDLVRIGSKGRHLSVEDEVRNGDVWSTRDIFPGGIG